MPHQIVPAVNPAGKRVPTCSYPEQMHDFQQFIFDVAARPLADRLQGVDTQTAVLCRRCGAALQPLPDEALPTEATALVDDTAIRYWADHPERS